MEGIDKILTPEFLAEAAANIEHIEARQKEDKAKVQGDIYDDFLTREYEGRALILPAPTLGFLLLYRERHDYFWDNRHGFGRFLWALIHKESVRELRAGAEIPKESDDLVKGIPAGDVAQYYNMVHEVAMIKPDIPSSGEGTLGVAGAFAQMVEFTHYTPDYLIYGIHYPGLIQLIQGMYDLSIERAPEKPKESFDD